MKLKCPGYDEFLGKGVHYAVTDLEAYGERGFSSWGRRLGPGLGSGLKDVASELLLIHRREAFRAMERSVAELRVADRAGELSFRDHHEVREIRGSDRWKSVVIFDNRSGEETTLEVDAVLTFLGFKPDLGPIKGGASS